MTIAKITTVVLSVVVAATAIIGCSPTQKIRKSNDPDLIYAEAIRLYEIEDWKNAAELFENIQPFFEGTGREDTLMFYKARCRYKERDYKSAVELLNEYRRTFGRSPFIEDAEGMYTMSYYFMSPSADRDQTMTHQAIMIIEEFLERYPNSEQRDTFEELKVKLTEKLHLKEYNNAYIYFKIERYKSAILTFKNALKKYPDSYLREDISYYIVASSYELAHKSVLSKKEDRYLSMIDSYYTFISEFPESEHRADVDNMLRKAKRYLDLAKRKREGENIDDKRLEMN